MIVGWLGVALGAPVYMPEMTSPEVQAALDAGQTTVLVPTGGVEQNGPWLTLDKHQIIAREVAVRTAEQLGNALVAPVVAFVPEGRWSLREGHFQHAGTVGVSEATFERILSDIARSYLVQGFDEVVFLGDSGGNQAVQKKVATALDRPGARVMHVPEFYDPDASLAFLKDEGLTWTLDDHHDDPTFTLQVLAVDPVAARLEARQGALTDGFSLEPLAERQALGNALMDHRAARTKRSILAQREAGSPGWLRRLGAIVFLPGTALLDPLSRFGFVSLSMGMLIAVLLTAWRQGSGWSLGSVFGDVFPARIYRSREALHDLLWMVLGGLFLFSAIGGFIGLIEPSITEWVLEQSSWLPSPRLPSTGIFAFIGGLLFFLVIDFSIWFGHYLSHRVPVLWTFHKTHHAAVNMTPLTVFRQHPVDLVVAGICVSICSALFTALWAWLTGGAAVNVVVFNLGTVLFYVVGYPLRHSHVWWSFGPLERVFISPAMHQIHHSADPRHYDRNMGLVFSFWDHLFGTAVRAEPFEQVSFGIGDDGEPFQTAWDFFWQPFREVFSRR